MSDENKGRKEPSDEEFDLIDLYERLLRGETSPAGKRRKLRELLVRHERLIQQKPEIDDMEKEKPNE